VKVDAGLAPRMRVLDIRPPEVGDLAPMLKVLADETRLRIFSLLTSGELCVCEIVDVLDAPQSLVSNHLRVLRRAGLVRARRDAVDNRWVYYSPVPEAVEALRSRVLSLLDLSRMETSAASCWSEPRCGSN
jgi:ArsR family transcriptional regulator, arsenate/arsenite/antimonite-responsive transcriptional repressor